MTDHRAIWTRRRFLLASAVATTGMSWAALAADNLILIEVWKDPNCGCCQAWVEHLRGAGFSVSVRETSAMRDVKTRLGVPSKLTSCHTAKVGTYVIEGHVPATAISRLLKNRPAARGLAVPGMPIGSPGMEGGKPDTYDVILFGDGKDIVFDRYVGARRIT